MVHPLFPNAIALTLWTAITFSRPMKSGGLYVASKDAREAFDSVSPILQELISLKLKIACEIEAPMTFNEFTTYVDAQATLPAAPELANREFIVRRAQQA